jgi:hypothetical protein
MENDATACQATIIALNSPYRNDSAAVRLAVLPNASTDYATNAHRQPLSAHDTGTFQPRVTRQGR